MAQYKSYKNNKRKISKIWDSQFSSEVTLAEAEFELRKLFLERNLQKSDKLIYDSGWTAVAPEFTAALRTTKKDGILPGELDFDHIAILNNIPIEYLSYFKIQTLFRCPPNVFVKGADFYSRTLWGSDYYEITNGDTIFYKGVRRDAYFVFTLNQITAAEVSIDHTKKVWQCNFEYSDAGQHYRIEGNIGRITLYKALGTSCDVGQDNIDHYFSHAGETSVHSNSDHKILTTHRVEPTDELSLDVEVTFKGIRSEDRYINTNTVESYLGQVSNDYALLHNVRQGIIGINSVKVNGGDADYSFTAPNVVHLDIPAITSDLVEIDYQYCDFVSTDSDSDNWTLNFEDLSRFILRWESVASKHTLDEPGGEVISTVSFGGGEVDTDTVDSINDINFSLMGYRMFYDIDTKYSIGINSSGVLTNLPDPADVDFTTIQLLRNPDGYPLQTITNELAAPFTTIEPVWMVLKNYGNGLAKYMLQIGIQGFAFAPASNLSSTQTFNVFDDIYSASGSTFVPVNDHTTIPKLNYNVEGMDIEYKIQVSFLNPFTDFTQVKLHGTI